ncbi:zinc finger BED domain-containing protein 5-like [Metopolophium dirhodum]|uniref:zinc finger BED domain-containing protein 5-like n=1 Tax=Metopolophium dirhodum TaxID=44670 RepID=UPI002990250B|nr:zinc finger BED domain-containing protein 5-like [Metopolophium dirhodum]
MHNWLRTGRLLAKTTSNNIDETVASSSTIESQQVILKDAIPSCSITNVMENNSHSNISEKSIVVPEIIELKPSKKRKYDESYLQFGFIPVGTAERPDGQCVICNVILQNSSLAPAKLKRHLKTNHPNLMNKEMGYFKKRKEEHNSSLSALHKYAKNDSENATEASFILSYSIARAGKPHTIAESLIKPCMTEIVRCMIGEEAAKKIATVQCSNNTISDRIHKISDHIEDQLINRLKSCNMFAIQLDESTDVAGLSILLVFVRYIFETSIEEDLLLCTPLDTNTTGEEIFKVIDSYMNKHQVDWVKCIDVCSDGAAAMVGKIKGTVTRIKNVAPKCHSSHCVLHRHAFVSKKMPLELKQVLNEAVCIVNYIKSRPLQSRLFKKVCEEMGSQHYSLLLHTEVRWLSRGKVLSRLFELRDDLKIFFSGQNLSISMSYVELLHDDQWLIKLAYLADIFSKLNEVNKSLQGKTITTFVVRDKNIAFRNKLNFWIACVNENNFECFPLLMDFLKENESQLTTNIKKIVIEHLENLEKSLSQYFPATNNDVDWIQNPFVNKKKPAMLSMLEYEQLIEIKSMSNRNLNLDL